MQIKYSQTEPTTDTTVERQSVRKKQNAAELLHLK